MIPQVSFYYRNTENNHDKNVIEDLFAIAESDALICASSSFAFIAMILGDHSVIIFPEHAITMPDKVIIDKVKVIRVQNPDNYSKRKVTSATYGINNIF
jgi:predicted glycosyltransferase